MILRLVGMVMMIMGVYLMNFCESQTTSSVPTAEAWLTAHNNIRRQYQVPDLITSVALTESAFIYSRVLASWCNTTLTHSDSVYGENLSFFKKSTSPTADEVVAEWASEVKYIDKATLKCKAGLGLTKCGHYTQLVWRMTQYVGCGVSVCNNSAYYSVCHYARPGNCNSENWNTTNSPCPPKTNPDDNSTSTVPESAPSLSSSTVPSPSPALSLSSSRVSAPAPSLSSSTVPAPAPSLSSSTVPAPALVNSSTTRVKRKNRTTKK